MDWKTEKLKQLERLRNPNAGLLERIHVLKGDPGDTPLKGVDYYTPDEIAQIKKEVTPRKGIDYTDGKDGERGSVFLGSFSSESKLPDAKNCAPGDFAIIDGEIWYIV